MKTTSLLLTFLVVTMLFTACSIEKRHYNSGYHVEWYSQNGKNQKVQKAEQPLETESSTIALEGPALDIARVETEELSAVEDFSISKEESAAQAGVVNHSQSVSKKAELSAPAVKVEKVKTDKVKISQERGFTAQTFDSQTELSALASDVDLIVLVILAIFLPPLAVFLHSGITNRFWISLVLTLLFWVPGVIYALLVVLDAI